MRFLQETIREKSFYPKGPYEVKVLGLLQKICEKIGMKKLINSIIKSIDINDLQRSKNLLSIFVDE